jgi:hypothetical protein
MKPTTLGLLIKIACITLVLGWAINAMLWWFLSVGFGVGAGSPAGIAVVDLSLLFWTIAVRKRMPRTSKAPDGSVSLVRATNPLSQLVAARTAALALAASRAGSALAGFYFGLAAAGSVHMSADYSRTAVVLEVLTAVLAIGLVAIALWLEHICKLPRPPLETSEAAEAA